MVDYLEKRWDYFKWNEFYKDEMHVYVIEKEGKILQNASANENTCTKIKVGVLLKW